MKDWQKLYKIKKLQRGGKTDWLEDFKETGYVTWKKIVGPGKGKVGFESVDMDLILPRQGYKESTFLDKNVKGKNSAGAIGIAQIKQKTLKDYPELKGFNLRDPKQGVKAQKIIMEDLITAPFIDKPYQPDSVTVAKGLGAYNWGRGNLSNYLNAQKKKGVDIYNTWDWLEGLPKETKDYVNKVLRGKDPKFEKNFKDVRKHPYMKFYQMGGVINQTPDLQFGNLHINSFFTPGRFNLAKSGAVSGKYKIPFKSGFKSFPIIDGFSGILQIINEERDIQKDKNPEIKREQIEWDNKLKRHLLFKTQSPKYPRPEII